MTTSDVELIGRALDGLAVRHRVVASNLANQSTPGFKRSEVTFEDQLEGVLKGRKFEPEIEIDRSQGNGDGNNVEAETELATLTRVELVYQVLTRSLQHKANMMRLAMSKGQ